MLLQRCEQVLEGRGTEGVLLEVVARAGVEVLAAHVVHQLLEHRSTLGISDAIEILARGIYIRDLGLNRVRGGQLILQVGPVLSLAGEVDPRLGVLGGVHRGIRAHKLREGFLEPQVIPPLRRDQVTEPHVGHLVQDGVRAPGMLRAGSGGTEEVMLRKGHQAGVLHGTQVVLWHEDGIVLAPRVGIAKVAVEKVHALCGDLQDLIIQVVGHGGAGEGAQFHAEGSIGCGPRAVLLDVRPRRKRRQIRRQQRGRRELRYVPAIRLLAANLRLVAEELPAFRTGEVYLVAGLEIRLVKAGKNAACIRWLEV